MLSLDAGRVVTRATLLRRVWGARRTDGPPCANLAARNHPLGLEIAMGGRTAMNPDISRVTIPE